MLSTRLVHLIEQHADQLTLGLLKQLKSDPRTTSFRTLADEDIRHVAFKIYGHLGEVLEGRAREEFAHQFEDLGRRRCREGVPIAEMMWAVILNKKTVLAYIHNNEWGGTALEVLGEEQLMSRIGQFYNDAIYYTAMGYQKAAVKEPQLAAAHHR